MPNKPTANNKIVAENEVLRARLEEAQETLRAIHMGEVDAVVISGADGDQIFTLKGADHTYRLLIENMNEGALVINDENVIFYCNRRFAEIIKMPLEKVIGTLIDAWVAPQSKRQFQELLRRGRHDKHHEELFVAASKGPPVPVYISSRRQISAESPSQNFLVVTDLTEIDLQKKTEERLTLEASVFTHAREGIMITAPDGTIIDVNDAFTRITCYPRDEVLGRKPDFLCANRHDKDFFAAVWRDLIETHHWGGEVWCERNHGQEYPVMLNISSLHDANGDIRQFMALISDITTIKEHQKKLEHMAHYDALTQLPNRVLLADRLQLGMAQMQRRMQHLAVVFLDLDQFKNVNDTYGHEMGDQLLVALAARMKRALRLNAHGN